RETGVRSRSLRSLVVAAILLASCAAEPPPAPPLPPPVPAPESFPPLPPQADLWDAPRTVLTEAGYTVVAEDRAKGVLTARVTRSTPTPADQRAAIADLGRIAHIDDPRLGGAVRRMESYAVTVHVRVGSPGSSDISMAVKAELQVTERVQQKKATASVTHPVPSRGVLEKDLIAKIQQRLEE
ncbi:MAG: hypothetical protein ACREQJ_18340, partial [Candidatus Binatia bacterium]